MTDPAEGAARHLQTRLALVVLVLTAVVFAPGLTGDFVYDDWLLIVRNEHIRDPGGLPEVLTSPFWDVSSRADRGRAAYAGLWRPWVSLSYVTEFQAFGEDPIGYHVVGLLLHLANVGLAFALLRRRLPGGSAVPLACAVGAALFAVHPSRPETVSWISGSTDLWMSLWLLLGILALQQPKRTVRVFGGLCFALAVWSKEAALLVPLLLLSDAWLVEGRRPRLDREGIAGAGALVALGTRLLVAPGTPEGLVVGGPQVVPRVLSTVGCFVARIVWPHPASMEPALRAVDAQGHEVFEPWSIALGAAVLVGLAALAVVARRRPAARPYLADLLWFLVLLAPVSNLIDLGAHSLVSDRFLYLPLLGVSMLVSRGVLASTRRWEARGRVAAVVALAAVLAVAPLTAVRATEFESDQVLWAAELEHNPHSLVAHREVAMAAEARGDRDTALRLLVRGAEIAESRGVTYEAVRFHLDAARIVLRKTSDADQETLRKLRDFYDRLAGRPEMRLELDGLRIRAHLSQHDWDVVRRDTDSFLIPRAISHARTLQLESAEAQLRAIVERSPRQPAAWNLLVAVYGRQGEWERAVQAARAAASHMPGDETIEAMGRSLARARAIARQPAPDDVARAIRDARVQVALGAPEAARRILDAARRDHPADPRLIVERAKADVADGRFDLARSVIETARREDPANRRLWDTALERLESARREARTGDR